MSFKVIERMKHACDKLIHGIAHNKQREVSCSIHELEEENEKELRLAREFTIHFLLSLHGFIERELVFIKQHLGDRHMLQHAERIKKALDEVVDQRKVRDELIKRVMHPLFRKAGYSKKKRAFVKARKKVNVYTSRVCEYYAVQFTFEITIKGTKYNRYRLDEKWFTLTQDANFGKVEHALHLYITRRILPFLEDF